jgi:hypothetical protein
VLNSFSSAIFDSCLKNLLLLSGLIIFISTIFSHAILDSIFNKKSSFSDHCFSSLSVFFFSLYKSIIISFFSAKKLEAVIFVFKKLLSTDSISFMCIRLNSQYLEIKRSFHAFTSCFSKNSEFHVNRYNIINLLFVLI